MTTMPSPTTQIIETITDLWGFPLNVSGCTHCRQIFLIEETVLGKICPYCFRGQLEKQPGNIRIEPPELLIPYLIENNSPEGSINSLQSILIKFTRGLWLHTNDFNSQSLLQRAQKIFMPMWMLDCTVHGNWEAEVGYDYQVESSQDNFIAGEWKTNKVIETRVRWEPRLGQLKRPYNNVAVPAISDHHKLQQLVGDFQMANAHHYQKDMIISSILRIPDLQTDETFPIAQSYLKNVAADECCAAASAQHIRNFSIDASYKALHWTLLLLPFYSTYYVDDQGITQVIWINGESGSIGGPRLASQNKGWIWAGVSAGIALLSFLLALACFALTTFLALLAVVGTILVFIAIAAGIFAIIPAIYPWLWNRKQLDRKIHVYKTAHRKFNTGV